MGKGTASTPYPETSAPEAARTVSVCRLVRAPLWPCLSKSVGVCVRVKALPTTATTTPTGDDGEEKVCTVAHHG